MIRAIIVIAALSASPVFAEANEATHTGGHMDHQAMDHSHMMQGETAKGRMPIQAGQSAFAAIQEIVEILISDPKTDWSKVNIDALRNHLVDMDAVTLHAQAKSENIDGGIRFIVTGDGPVRGSIRRMVNAHAATMNGVNGWTLSATDIENGAILMLHVPASDMEKVKALGFFGIMTVGMHHQTHHMMIARGGNPHH